MLDRIRHRPTVDRPMRNQIALEELKLARVFSVESAKVLVLLLLEGLRGGLGRLSRLSTGHEMVDTFARFADSCSLSDKAICGGDTRVGVRSKSRVLVFSEHGGINASIAAAIPG